MAPRVSFLVASLFVVCASGVQGTEGLSSNGYEGRGSEVGSSAEPLWSPEEEPGPGFGFSTPQASDVPSEAEGTSTPSRPRGGTPMDMMMGGRGGGGPFQYRADWFPDAAVTGQAARWGMVGQELSVMLPVHISPPDFWAVSAAVGQRHVETSAQLPDTQQAYPENLWNVRLGLNYFRMLDNGWMAGTMVNVGSASDRPFASINEITAGFIGFLRVPHGERHAWLLSLMYSPTSELGFPIPGVAFDYRPSDNFHANLGLPLSMMWKPADDWTVDASYFPIRVIHVKATRRLGEALSAFASYDWSNESYFLYDRSAYNDRFFLYDQRVSLGVQYVVSPQWTIDFSAGYSFDRYSYEGDAWGNREYNRIDINSTPFTAFRCGMRF